MDSTPPRKRQRRLQRGGRRGDDSSSSSESDSDVGDGQGGAGDELDARAAAARLLERREETAESGRAHRRGPALVNESDEDDDGNANMDESDGEDLQETAVKDYREIGELDSYDRNQLDEDAYDPISAQARMAAEMAMRERDVDTMKGRARVPGMLEDSDSEDSDEEDRERAARREAYEHAAAQDGLQAVDTQEDQVDDAPIDLQNLDAPVRELLQRDSVVHELKRRFASFLREYGTEGGGKAVYVERINQMCSKNSQSLVASYQDLCKARPILAIWIADYPKIVLSHLHEVALEVVLEYFPDYKAIHEEVFVRINELPLQDSLRDLRTIHLNALIKVSGIVTRRTQVLPLLKQVKYTCTDCTSLVGPFPPNADPGACGQCQGEHLKLCQEESVYCNYQRILLQESPGSVPPGRVPRYKSISLSMDLIDMARPGEEIEVTGIYTNEQSRALNSQQNFPVFQTGIEAVHIQKKEDLSSSILITNDDKREFAKLAKDPQIVERIINSMAPSIYGHKHVKTALALSMFGGQQKNVKNKHRIRGDVNVLLMGDPGTAKSQCLKYVEKTAPRAVFTTGKGASAVGLTAAVQKDPITREWVLEGGALVLADRGVCLIDEFDKMADKDRTSIHEAMEQQSISISKAGIVTTLQARCSIIAAANPINGRYNPMKNFVENVELTDPIIQRFDILCILQDSVDPIADERLAKFVVSSHLQSHPAGCVSPEEARAIAQRCEAGDENADPAINVNTYASWSAETNQVQGTIDQTLLRKYILYARTLRPQLERIDHNKIEALYVDLRQQSRVSGGIPIAVRHMESILRMSEAFARMSLREYVRNDDVDHAIAVMLESFSSAQKRSVKHELKRKFQKFMTFKKDSNELLVYLLEELFSQNMHLLQPNQDYVQVSLVEFEGRAREVGVHDCSEFYRSDGFIQRDFEIRDVPNPARPDLNTKIIVKSFTSV
mmetsp:Transcript_24487/g.39794  ORF Transcript_24487/g.39794 Transcript_24487/m.39794 type:complete len:955 (+) Transcript_24487:185-3049(+)